MKLSDLNPEFRWQDDGQGGWLEADCPHCGARYLSIPFSLPPTRNDHVWIWNGVRDAEGFGLTPSIRLNGHFHVNINPGSIALSEDDPSYQAGKR
ncbi:MAG TPA: hypothetical protein VF787_03440 [Thermoanaerobaculia bacterium]